MGNQKKVRSKKQIIISFGVPTVKDNYQKQKPKQATVVKSRQIVDINMSRNGNNLRMLFDGHYEKIPPDDMQKYNSAATKITHWFNKCRISRGKPKLETIENNILIECVKSDPVNFLPQTKWKSLDFTCLLHIIRFMNPGSIMAMSRTCKIFNLLFTSNYGLDQIARNIVTPIETHSLMHFTQSLIPYEYEKNKCSDLFAKYFERLYSKSYDDIYGYKKMFMSMHDTFDLRINRYGGCNFSKLKFMKHMIEMGKSKPGSEIRYEPSGYYEGYYDDSSDLDYSSYDESDGYRENSYSGDDVFGDAYSDGDDSAYGDW